MQRVAEVKSIINTTIVGTNGTKVAENVEKHEISIQGFQIPNLRHIKLGPVAKAYTQ